MTIFSGTFLSTSTKLSAIGAITLLSACGGTGTTGPTYQELASEFVALANDAPTETSDFFVASNLPTSGGQTYDGVFSILLSEEASGGPVQVQVLGDMTMTANFGTGAIGGGVDNFSDNSGDTFSGSVNFTGGSIDRGAAQANDSIFANADGTIVSANTGAAIDVDGFVSGAFAGDQYEYVIGGFIGTLGSGLNELEINFSGDADGSGVFLGER